MGDPGDGWKTVLPTSHSGIERLARPQLEAYERQILKEWESTRGHWSGIGKHTPAHDFKDAKKIHDRLIPAKRLGSGAYGLVEKVSLSHNHRTVCLARKYIPFKRGRNIQFLREEANVMEKLDHEHIVKLVGSYCIRQNELYLLLWPVAVCNLENLVDDLDFLRTGQGDREDIISRLEALDLTDISALERRGPGLQSLAGRGNCPLKYLQQMIGCVTRAVAYCHGANIRHLDLKPSNILLSPGRVYLADFGIARDVNDRDHTMTLGQQGTPKWRAPEVCDIRDEWSMKAADVYSLGLILLNVATILYGASMADFDALLEDMSPRPRAERITQYHHKLEALALATQEVHDIKAPTFAPKHVVNLTSRMLSSQPPARPRADQVDVELVELGGIGQVYHSPCCKKSNRFVTERISAKFKMAVEERDRMLAEHEKIKRRLEVLERRDETYETRIQNERKAHAENIAHLQEQLEKERKERKAMEARLAEMTQQSGRRPARSGISRPGTERGVSGGGSPASPSGLMMRTRPRTHPAQAAACVSPSPQSQSQPRLPPPTVAMTSRPSYSQAAAAAVAVAARPIAPVAVRRPSISVIPTRTVNAPPTPTHIPPNSSPSPNSAGFALRSRNSGSRLPRAVNPSTPMRSNTPNLNRDPSLTDSTQYSMSSSIFSRISGRSRDSESAAETSVAGTPAIGSPAVNDALARGVDGMISGDIDNDSTSAGNAGAAPEGIGLGIDFEMAQRRRESITQETNSVREDTASVISSSAAAPTVSSPILGGSTLSSPRAVHATIADGQSGTGVRIPPLPMAKSWADVAKREESSTVKRLHVLQ